jgi:UrcA family protein
MNSNVKTAGRTPFAFSTALLLACVLSTANAYAEDQFRTETVKFHDLNTNTSAGIEALYGRIHAAAKSVCGVAGGGWEQIRELRCTTKAVAQAIEKANLPALTAYYQAKTGSRPETLTVNR